MKRFAAVLGCLCLGSFSGTSAIASEGETWAHQIFEASRAAEREVARGRVRVASLGNVGASDEESRPRPRRTKMTAPEDRPQAVKRTRVASLDLKSDADERPRRSLSGGSVSWTADAGCLNGTLRGIVRTIAAAFGPVTVNSTCRSRSRNAAVGGAPKSMHLQGEAVDFRVHSNVSAVYASLRGNGSVGGLKHYGGGLFHIDTGPRRSW